MAAQSEMNNVSLSQKHDVAVAESGLGDANCDAFECNICLDLAQEPVVTLCGHLYCWPCIYRWLQVQESYDESHQQPQCPICKTNISASELVPLYGRDASRSNSRNTDHGLGIPSRPASELRILPCLTRLSSHTYSHLHRSNSQRWSPTAGPTSQLDAEALSIILNPMICSFGEMIYARIFGNSDFTTLSYPYIVSSNPRIRRQEEEVEESLNRCYDLDAYNRHKMEKELKKGIKHIESEMTVFNDEEQRRLELLREREKQKEEEVEALKRSTQGGMAAAAIQ